MLIEKEVIRPGIYFYRDEQSGLPRKLDVTPELTKHWFDQGNAMLSAGLTVPVPYEHDFDAHPMTPKDRLLNNAGEVKQYTLKGDRLFSTVDVQDPAVRDKIGRSVRWTSPWINSFTDGDGKEWKNVISHLALTTRPRIVKQEPFGSVAAALSMATETKIDPVSTLGVAAGAGGFCLSRAGRLFMGRVTRRLRPRYPMAFSMWAGGVPLAASDMPPPKKKKGAVPGAADPAAAAADPADDFGGDLPENDAAEDMPDDGDPTNDSTIDLAPFGDPGGDIQMEELLCDLLQALGVPMPDESNEAEFKRHLYEAVMSKIKELTSKGMGGPQQPNQGPPDQNKPPGQNPHASKANPLIGQVQQEQQPMYMSLGDINKLPDPMKGVALAMYNENAKLRAELDTTKKVTDSLRDAKLKEAGAARTSRVSLISRLSPRVKTDLDAMLAMPGMALSMGDGGAVVDPMAQTLAVLEKGLADMPRLLTTDYSAMSVQPQPQDADMLTDARSDEIADAMARQMGCPPQRQAG